MEYTPTLNTLIFVSIFLVVFVLLLVRNAINKDIDIYDLFKLSAVALLPSLFVFFPKETSYLTRLVGVGFPFILMFGILFFVVFIFLYRLVIKQNRANQKITVLLQEVALLKQKLKKGKK